jgi:ribosomal protein L40E
MKCLNCQFENAAGATVCAQCGSPLQSAQNQQGGYNQGYAAPSPQYQYRRMPVNCQVCGAMNPPGTTVCEKCYATTDPNAVYSDKNRTTALILAVLLGFIGAHRFYVGKTGMGILYIFTGGLFGIGILVDVIKIITGDSRDSNGYPLRKGCFI